MRLNVFRLVGLVGPRARYLLLCSGVLQVMGLNVSGVEASGQEAQRVWRGSRFHGMLHVLCAVNPGPWRGFAGDQRARLQKVLEAPDQHASG